MKKRDRKALERYLRTVADEMGLRDWTVNLASEPSEEGDAANALIPFGRKSISICVPANFRVAESPEDQRDTIIHEFVHCHFESMASMVQNDLEKLVGSAAHTIFFSGFERQYEYGVDAMAAALSKRMPLIEWPD